MDIIQLYRSILESLGLQVDEAGMVSMLLDDEPYPCTVGDKRLVLPTQKLLRSGDWAGKIAFHPISENVLRGESPVLKKLRVLINHRLTEVISVLLTELMEIAANTAYHDKLTPTQSEFLSYVKDADAKTVKSLNNVLKSISTTGDKRLVSIYLKRGGKWKGEKYSRVAVASFPIMDEFETPDQSIFGVKLERKRDKKTIESLFKFLIPDANDLEEYSYGTNSLTAPYFHALCHSYLKVARQLNKITRRFRRHLDNPEALMISTDWESAIDNVSEYRDLIPTLEGNDGVVVGEEEVPAIQTPAQVAPPLQGRPAGYPVAPTAPVVPTAPVQAPDGSVKRTARGLDWNSVMESQRRSGAPVGFQQPPFASAPTPFATGGGFNRGAPQYPQQFHGGFQQQPTWGSPWQPNRFSGV